MKIGTLNMLIGLLFLPLVASADCTVEEMQRMARGGTGKDAIKDQCDYEVSDAPRCSFTRVVTLVMAKKLRYEIDDECGLCDNATCETERGSCSLGRAPPGQGNGSACTCFTPYGPITGEVACE